jgi:minor extracellular serine protease Vpr
MLDIADAIMATTLVTPAKLSLGECLTVPHTAQLAITNKSAGAITYTLSHVPALSTGPNSFHTYILYGICGRRL